MWAYQILLQGGLLSPIVISWLISYTPYKVMAENKWAMGNYGVIPPYL